MPSNGDRSNAAKGGAFGMLSGAVAWALIVLVSLINPSFESPRWNGIIFNQVSLLPGLVFGSFIGLLLNRGSGLEWRRHLVMCLLLASPTSAHFTSPTTSLKI